jgi:hypothetical protein
VVREVPPSSPHPYENGILRILRLLKIVRIVTKLVRSFRFLRSLRSFTIFRSLRIPFYIGGGTLSRA